MLKLVTSLKRLKASTCLFFLAALMFVSLLLSETLFDIIFFTQDASSMATSNIDRPETKKKKRLRAVGPAVVHMSNAAFHSMKRPNEAPALLVLIGSAKSGTTSLREWLNSEQHHIQSLPGEWREFSVPKHDWWPSSIHLNSSTHNNQSLVCQLSPVKQRISQMHYQIDLKLQQQRNSTRLTNMLVMKAPGAARNILTAKCINQLTLTKYRPYLFLMTMRHPVRHFLSAMRAFHLTRFTRQQYADALNLSLVADAVAMSPEAFFFGAFKERMEQLGVWQYTQNLGFRLREPENFHRVLLSTRKWYWRLLMDPQAEYDPLRMRIFDCEFGVAAAVINLLFWMPLNHVEEAARRGSGMRVAVLQSEYLFDYTEQAVSSIDCWALCDRHDEACCVALRQRVLAKGRRVNEPDLKLSPSVLAGNQGKHQAMSKELKKKLVEFWKPVVQLTEAVMRKYSSKILIGQWLPWPIHINKIF